MVVYLDRLSYINNVSRLRSTLGNTLSICSGEIRRCAEEELLPSILIQWGHASVFMTLEVDTSVPKPPNDIISPSFAVRSTLSTTALPE